MIIFFFILFFSILLINYLYDLIFNNKVIEGVVGNSSDNSNESVDFKLGKLMSQVDTNTSDIKTLKDQMVAVNTNIDSISNNQKQQKNIY